MATMFHKLPQPWMMSRPVQRVIQAIRAAGGEARFVGGCVRDALLGRRIKDIDLATPMRPELVMAALAAADLGCAPTGLAHGTVTAIADGKGIEVTTLRRDLETDGRRAKVDFTDDWQADAARRDLTINALFADAEGRVFDYFDGLGDLAQGRVRFVGDPEARLAEDYLRILRFFRFHADYATGPFDDAALKAAIAARENLARLSAERLQQETLKILLAARAIETWGAMLEAGILAVYLPQASAIARLAGVARLEQAFAIEPDALRRLGALVGPDQGRAVANRLKFSNADTRRLAAIAAARPPLDRKSPAALRRTIYAMGNKLALDCLLVDHNGAPVPDLADAFALIRNWPSPAFPLAGRDLLTLGLAPGPRIASILAAVEAWWIEGDFTADRDACLDEARRRLAAP